MRRGAKEPSSRNTADDPGPPGHGTRRWCGAVGRERDIEELRSRFRAGRIDRNKMACRRGVGDRDPADRGGVMRDRCSLGDVDDRIVRAGAVGGLIKKRLVCDGLPKSRMSDDSHSAPPLYDIALAGALHGNSRPRRSDSSKSNQTKDAQKQSAIFVNPPSPGGSPAGATARKDRSYEQDQVLPDNDRRILYEAL